MQNTFGRILFAATLVLTAVVHAEAQDESRCIDALYKAAGKYRGCETKAFAAGDLLKCREKYTAVWPKLGTKYPGTSCDQARFTDDGATITDNLTRLVWEKKTTTVGSGTNPSDRHDVDNTYIWSSTGTNADGTAFTDFLDDLNGSGFAGQHDWRLPSVIELATITACGVGLCTVGPIFDPAQSGYYASSTPLPDMPTHMWLMDIFNGTTVGAGKTTGGYFVRAVRSGL